MKWIKLTKENVIKHDHIRHVLYKHHLDEMNFLEFTGNDQLLGLERHNIPVLCDIDQCEVLIIKEF